MSPEAVSPIGQAVLVAVFTVAVSVWVGGLVVLAVVARVTRGVLSPADRVQTFRGIGRAYGPIAGAALLLALGLGLLLAWGRPRDGAFWLACAVGVALVAVTAVGVVQARAISRLRHATLNSDTNDRDATDRDATRLRASAVRASVLRATIGVLTLVLVVLGSLLASD